MPMSYLITHDSAEPGPLSGPPSLTGALGGLGSPSDGIESCRSRCLPMGGKRREGWPATNAAGHEGRAKRACWASMMPVVKRSELYEPSYLRRYGSFGGRIKVTAVTPFADSTRESNGRSCRVSEIAPVSRRKGSSVLLGSVGGPVIASPDHCSNPRCTQHSCKRSTLYRCDPLPFL